MIKKLSFFALLASTLFFTGCPGVVPGPADPDYKNQGEAVAPRGSALSPYEQKQKLEDAGKAALDEVDIDYWSETADFINDLMDHLDAIEDKKGDRAFKAFDEWAEEVRDEILFEKIADTKLTRDVTFAMSRLPKGVFTEDNGVFEFEEGGNKLVINTFADDKPVTITLTNGAEGEEFNVYSTHWAAKDRYDLEYHDGELVASKDETVYVKVPKWVQIDVRQGGKLRMSWNESFDIKDSDKDGVLTYERDDIETSVKTTVGDYTLTTSEKYTGGSSASQATASSGLQFTHKAKNIVIASFDAAADPDGINELINDGDSDYDMLKTVNASVDVMGLVQAKGSVEYAKAYYMFEKLDANASEDSYAKNVAAIEKCFNIAIYYDRKSGRQAWFGLEPLLDSRDKWTVNPVIRFADETSYGLGDFFNEDDFRSLLRAIDKWAERIDDYFDEK